MAISAILVLIGIGSLFVRGRGILDIDFAGGSSVQFGVSQPTDADENPSDRRNSNGSRGGENIPYTVNGVSMEGAPEETVYKVDSSLEDVNELKAAVEKAFADDDSTDLVTYNVSITPTGGDPSGDRLTTDSNGVMLTAAVAQDEAATDDEADAATEKESDETAAAEPQATSQWANRQKVPRDTEARVRC